ncbi:putative Sel1 domain-containing protein [Magnetofaba australis IT-1]|uniref:Putative Sel1 domain-containing protein n=2 Tax=Magnetofaba TaxID=1472292 RepID=A0A1Y2K283_9PROT|nr:putative Sel1 domain-containing protein [Magnetofaba australis IT-1]
MHRNNQPDNHTAQRRCDIAKYYLERIDIAMTVTEPTPYVNAVRLMAEQGDPDAQHTMGALLLQGEEIAQDFDAAAQWHRLAAEQGHPDAQHDLGVMAWEGLGCAPDAEAARQWFTLAAQQGNPDARNNLGVLWATGEGGAQDLAQACYWFALAARDGLPDAQDNLQQARNEASEQEWRAAQERLDALTAQATDDADDAL